MVFVVGVGVPALTWQADTAHRVVSEKKGEWLNVRGKNNTDPAKILLHPVGTEKAVRLLDQNKVVFVVDRRANKHEIKEAFQSLFDVKVQKINTEILREGVKKAYIKLHADDSAIEVATNLGLL
ncbi:MAG: 50S ribosomal protein L23 [Candidatus Altiarchaeota archaeon]|nr:50S ribosomal protein L23 [Candidatus Altiarchaeota archaeon]